MFGKENEEREKQVRKMLKDEVKSFIGRKRTKKKTNRKNEEE